MKIADFLSRTDAIVEQRALAKGQLLKELCRRAATGLQLKPGYVASAIAKREELGSTGVGAGVAIPHARFPELTKPFGLLVRLTTPIDFEAVDGRPVDLVFLLLAPTSPEGEQLSALACIARALRDQKVVAKIRKANDGAAVYEAATTLDEAPAATVPEPKPIGRRGTDASQK